MTDRIWYYRPWGLTNPLWPPVWRGGDEYGRRTIALQPPLLGALVIAVGKEVPNVRRFREAADALESAGPRAGLDPRLHEAMIESYRDTADALLAEVVV